MKHSESAELATIICLAVETAMRRGELARLTWSNIDLKKCIAHKNTMFVN
nr:tyrosine-type recombinase/integrase [Glaciimonas immobilis]